MTEEQYLLNSAQKKLLVIYWLTIKTGSIHHFFFFLKTSCTESGILQFLFDTLFICMLTILSVVQLFSSYIVYVCPSVLVCKSDLISLNRRMTFGQQYTTVAFMYVVKVVSGFFFRKITVF